MVPKPCEAVLGGGRASLGMAEDRPVVAATHPCMWHQAAHPGRDPLTFHGTAATCRLTEHGSSA